ARTAAGPALPRSATARPLRAAPPARRPHTRRTARTGAPACRGPAARTRAAGPRFDAGRSRSRRVVHDPSNLHRVLGVGDHPGGDLTGPFLIDIEDPVAGQGLLDFGERPVGRHRDTVDESDGRSLARVDERLAGHTLT